ncbi:hypothetical protein C6P40_004546 [Pichia californica]|uniref:Uncharacterized protein n=1 Tax=Pichia californica TaxID=460514 RepID=A0A9P6WMM0_9ASCO|nr:hypothetical protein C6P42_005003 [[Candida] californica]KAG0689744.1 hypothetical protein C6P40_004546 [[Candida] californica]
MVSADSPTTQKSASQHKVSSEAPQLEGKTPYLQSRSSSSTSLRSTNSTNSKDSKDSKDSNFSSNFSSNFNFTSFGIHDAIIRSLRVLFSTIYLIYIILTIPLSFEVGGLNCGLSYSLTILILYFCLATLRVLKYHRFISSFLYYMQHLLLPTLLSFFLTIFNNNLIINNNNINNNDVFSSSILRKIWWEYIIQFWKFFLINSTPLFTILEGFCSLLSIQAIGQLFKYFIKNKSDIWSILNLVLSSCILSASIYFAGKIYVSPLIDLENVGLISASLLGSVFTLTILITFYAIYFNRTTTLESSLMVAYIVKCCYELFPELSNNNISSLFKFVFNEFKKIDNQAKQSLTLNKESIKLFEFINLIKSIKFVQFWKNYWKEEEFIEISNNIASKFPKLVQKSLEFFKIIKNFGKILFDFIIEHFPRSFEPLWDFFKISLNNLTFSILMQLAYRITVFFAATKIIPILSPMRNISKQKQKQQSTSSRLIYLYSPCIIIAVYTNLMIQYNYEIDKETHLFTWIHNKVFELFFTSSSLKSVKNSIMTPSSATSTLSSYITSDGFNTIVNNISSSSSSSSSTTVSSSIFSSIHSWQFWNWINIFAVLLLYFSELASFDPEDSALTDHWN